MIPQFSTGVLSQRYWRGVGDIDDCAVLAAIACVHGCAPWVSLPSATRFRELAGNPDDQNAGDGLTISQVVKAVTALWPAIGAGLTVSLGNGSWTSLLAGIKAGRCASVSVFSAAMATKNGVAIRHSVSVYWSGTDLRVVNPLRRPHSFGTSISEAALKKAMDDMPEAGLWFVLFPTAEEAFATHPLYGRSVTP